MNIELLDTSNITEEELSYIYAYLDDNFEKMSDFEKYVWIEFISKVDQEFESID